MSVNLEQATLKRWQERNFPLSKYMSMPKEELVQIIHTLQMALGMCEEVGEVAHAVLKGTQNIREGRRGIDLEAISDGCGDVNIYATQLMTACNVNAEDAYRYTIAHVLSRDWINNPEDGGTPDAVPSQSRKP